MTIILSIIHARHAGKCGQCGHQFPRRADIGFSVALGAFCRACTPSVIERHGLERCGYGLYSNIRAVDASATKHTVSSGETP